MKQKIIDCHTHITHREDAKTYFKKNKNGFALVMEPPKFFKFNEEEFCKLLDSYPQLATIEAINIHEDIDGQLEKIKRNLTSRRTVGIKIYLGYQPLYADDERLKPVFAFAQKHQLTIIYHCGVIASEVAKDKKGSFYKYTSCLPIDDLAFEYPDVNFVIAHFNFPYMWDAAVIAENHKNVFTDFCGILEGSYRDKKLIRQIISDLSRIENYFDELYQSVLFGTDYFGDNTLYHEIQSYRNITKKVFASSALPHIFHHNALRAFPRLSQFLEAKANLHSSEL